MVRGTSLFVAKNLAVHRAYRYTHTHTHTINAKSCEGKSCQPNVVEYFNSSQNQNTCSNFCAVGKETPILL